ncbi:MAG TPA: type II toxin-antitoxin system VapC family toxin [Pirellulaceae bacterium]|jgi:hypothetical protein
MKPTVYLETTIIGYLAMRLSRDLRVAANQQMTRDWWDHFRHKYEPVVSRFVIDECAKGDPTAAQERQTYLSQLQLLDLPAGVKPLADALLSRVPLPKKATLDAFHISAAAVNSVEYLLTWNCRHIANAALRRKIDSTCRDLGYEPPLICTPQELMEFNHEF